MCKIFGITGYRVDSLKCRLGGWGEHILSLLMALKLGF